MCFAGLRLSLSARRAWIEIVSDPLPALKLIVALRKESVDRNREQFKYVVQCRKVALRKESVDRNLYLTNYHFTGILSLSARRAWIEISGLEHSIPVADCRSPQGERG